MGWGIAAAAAISAGASIASGAMAGGGGSPGTTYAESTGVDTSPGLKVAEFNNLLSMGIFDPTPLQQASPWNQLMGEVMSTSNYNPTQKKYFLHTSRLAMDWYEAGQPSEGPNVDRKGQFKGEPVGTLKNMLDRMLGLSGYRTLDDLMKAETAFQEQIQPLLGAAESAARGNFQAKLDVRAQIVNILGNLPDASAGGIQKLRAEEKSRLLRNLNLGVDEQRSDLLELANAGNFNPGRPLGDLEEFRAQATQDADLEALSRALALIGGQQSVAGTNLNMLYAGEAQTFNEAQALAAADQGLRSPQMINTNPIAPSGDALASGIAAAGNTTANAITAYTANEQSQANNAAYLDARFGPLLAPGN